VIRKWQDQPLEFLRGIPLSRSQAIEVRPGEIPGHVPDAAGWGAFEFNIRTFDPPRLGLPYNRPLPHINLDKVLQFMIA
jgi:predicted YcjX-like family ATPase